MVIMVCVNIVVIRVRYEIIKRWVLFRVLTSKLSDSNFWPDSVKLDEANTEWLTGFEEE